MNTRKMRKYGVISLAVISLIIAGRILFEPYRISGDCMEPTIKNAQLTFLNRISSYLRHYQIGDIIVFNHEGKEWISRIVALANNSIQITEGRVIVNGAALDDKKLHRNWSGWKRGIYAFDNPLQVPAGHVFVLFDNLSAEHDDSRVFGPISNSSILGLIW